jgi:GNAT superfamily N-acetyltransferase
MIKIKRGTPKHCKKIIQLAKQGDLFNYTHMFYSLLIMLGWLYVAVNENDEVIAYSCYAIVPVTGLAFSFQTAVDPNYRNMNIGADFLAHLEVILKKRHGVQTLFAHCLKPRVVKYLQRKKWEVVFNILRVALVKKQLR